MTRMTASLGDVMPRVTPIRYSCKECGWTGTEDAIIGFSDPEKKGNVWQLCPDCRAAEQFELLCHKCDQIGTIGTPLPGDYIWSCFKHQP